MCRWVYLRSSDSRRGRARLSAMPAMAESRHHRRIPRSKRRKNVRSIADRKASMTGLGRVLNSELILHCYSLELLRSRSCFFRHWFEPQRSIRNRRGAVYRHCIHDHALCSSHPRSGEEDELHEVGGCTPRAARQSSDGGLMRAVVHDLKSASAWSIIVCDLRHGGFYCDCDRCGLIC